MSNWFENHQPQRTQISSVRNPPYIQNSNQMASSVPQPQLFRAYSFNSFNIQGNIQPFRLTWLFWWQKLTWFFLVFTLRFVDFDSAFHEKPFESSLTVAWFFWANHNSLLRIATNEIASFCIDNRLRQMAFFVLTEVGKGRLSSNCERFWNKKAVVLCFFIV